MVGALRPCVRRLVAGPAGEFGRSVGKRRCATYPCANGCCRHTHFSGGSSSADAEAVGVECTGVVVGFVEEVPEVYKATASGERAATSEGEKGMLCWG